MTIAQHPRRIVRIAVIAAVAAVALSGCAPESSEHSASHSPSPSTSASASASPDASVEPSQNPDAVAEATPVGVSCDDIITAQNLYDFNPNFSRITSPSSVSATAKQATELKGIACYYVNQTSGELITVTVATPGPTTLAALRTDLAASATPAPALGDAWFANGQTTVLTGAHWVTVASDVFYEAADSKQLVDYVTSHLG